jgi:hypothetical protein
MQAELASVPWATIGIYTAAVIAAVLAILTAWVGIRSRPLPGDYVFRTSRLCRKNHLFPAQVVITPASLTLYKPQWVGKTEESIHIAHVASIRIETRLMFSDLFIESSGGQDPIECHGHRKKDALKMKELIERFQSDYYKRNLK